MASSRARRPTLADVARLAGVSPTAVSLILNDRPGSRLSAEVVARVHAAAEELGYRPNPAAQSLRLGRTRTIGFVSDQVTLTRFASGMIGGALEAARAHGDTVLLSEIGAHSTLAESVQELTDRRVDGLLVGLMAARMITPPPMPEGLPFVMVNGTIPGEGPCILPDESRAGETVAEHLIDQGHRSIGIVGDLLIQVDDPRVSATIAQRFAGIAAALDRAGIVPSRIEVPGWSPEIGYEYAGRLLDAQPGLTAIIAGNDSVAFGVYQATAERGLRIPEDLSLISFDDEVLAGFMRPGLTTARLPYEEMGRRGVELLHSDARPARTLLPMPLITRGSVSTPNADRG